MNLQTGLFLYLIIILSAIVHEFAHGWMANRLGDPTAKQMGRLTLNPLAHVDMMGTILLPLILLLFSGGRIFIGYAKPVPFNPLNLQNPRRDVAKIAIAGPAANFLMAIILGILLRFFGDTNFLAPVIGFLPWIIFVNIWLGLFNLIPVPPLDGSKILMSALPRERAISFSRALGPFGILIALLIAFMILPPLASLIFKLILGFPLL